MSQSLVPEAPKGELILFNSTDGSIKLECSFSEDNLWLTQALIADLYKKGYQRLMSIYQISMLKDKLKKMQPFGNSE